MPRRFNNRFKKKPNYRRRYQQNRRRLVRTKYLGPLGRRPQTYRFVRENWFNIDIHQTTVSSIGFPSYWHVQTTNTTDLFNFQPKIQFAQLINNSEFQNLFSQYKINAMSLTFYPSYTTNNAHQSQGTPNSGSGPSLLLWCKQNYTGVTETTLGQDDWAQISRKRTAIFCPARKPHSLYTKLKVMVPTVAVGDAGGEITTASTMIRKPGFQSTNDINAEYVGLTCALSTMNDMPLQTYGDGRLKFKIRERIYLECRYVK